ncbi:MAG: hypothetical protein ACXAEN_26550 [Candidatus Thorarchaeota archaeon]|jgi:Fe-S oxidoreductase
MRVEEALRTGARMLVTGCPFCVLNSEDSMKALGNDEKYAIRDIVEFLLV